jgi:hypothetical protein
MTRKNNVVINSKNFMFCKALMGLTQVIYMLSNRVNKKESVEIVCNAITVNGGFTLETSGNSCLNFEASLSHPTPSPPPPG